MHSNNNNINKNNCECDDDDDGEDEDDEEEDGLIKNSTIEPQKSQQKHLSEFFHHLQTNPMNNLSGSNGLITPSNTMNLLEDSNPIMMQVRLAQMMASAAASSNAGHDSMMHTFANIQRNFLFQLINDPAAAAQAAASAAVFTNQVKGNTTPISLITSNNNKQLGSGRKRKSTPEKRVITNHGSSNNNGDVRNTLCLSYYISLFRHLQQLNMNHLIILIQPIIH
jgi:hypothetical protein